MMKRTVARMTSSELFDEFLYLSLAHSKAMWGVDGPTQRRLFWKLDAVERELKSRPHDGRNILIPLQDHDDAGVRLQAAQATLAVDPIGARAALQKICDRSELPYAGYAGFTLLGLDRGEYIPT